MLNQRHKNKSLSWKSAPKKEIPDFSTWLDYGSVKRNNDDFEDYLKNQFVEIVKFKLYDNKQSDKIILEDVENNLSFVLPNDTKTRGYILAYKLFSKEIK